MEFPMHDAVKKNDLERVRQLIEEGVSVDSLDERGRTPLHVAASKYSCQCEVAELLINSKCNMNLKDCYGCTPVVSAIYRGRMNIVDLLLLRGAQVNCVDDNGCTPLHHLTSCSAGRRWTDIGRFILDRGEADLDAVDHDGETPLIWAARFGNEEIAALLIRAGADVNSHCTFKKTALHWAALRDHTEVIQILLEKEGLDLSPQDVNGDTPLHLSCKNYCPGVRKPLLDAGADINVKNIQGRTALSKGIRRRNLTHEEIGLFVQKGAFLESYDYQCISRNTFLKENVLKDVELCTQSVVNKFNHQSLTALDSIAYFTRRLPNVDNFKLGARHIDEVRNLVKSEIERNTFCNVVKVHPIALSALCVLSLITCQSGKKRAASTDFGHSPFKKTTLLNCIARDF